MSSVSIVVLVGASLALLCVVALVLWRRRQLAPVAGGAARLWANERTQYATTYEQLGVERPALESNTGDATACLAYDELGLGEAPEVEVTGVVDMDVLMPTPAPALAVMSSDLTFHFEVAVNTYTQWRRAMAGPRDLAAIAQGPERGWCDALALLVSQFTAADSEPLLATVRSPTSPEARVVAALALLEHRESEVVTLLSELLPEGASANGEILDALALWRGPSADATLLGAAAAQFPWRGQVWAELLRRRGIDPGAELLTRYLDAADPSLVCAGFELLAVHPDRRYRYSAIVARIAETQPALQAAAITAGLRSDMDIAWARCRELAMAADRPQLCELLASLGTLEDQRQLIAWASHDAAPAHALWCAALTGRAEAIELALARLDARGPLARACLTHLVGRPDADLEWWRINGESFWTDGRWLAGASYDGEAVRRGIAQLDGPHRWALARELGIRAPSFSALAVDGFARELARELDSFELASVDFERSFPWSLT